MRISKVTKTAMAEKLGVARSSLYYRPKKPEADEELRKRIVVVMTKNKAYGQRRVATALKKGKTSVSRVMRKFGLRPKIRRGRRPDKPGDKNQPETLIHNILAMLCPIRPFVVWSGDFTYFWFQGRFWYLATVIDVCTREIVGWHIANHHTTALIIEAFKDAVRRMGRTPKYFHSDQGSEYVSGLYRLLLASHGVDPSNSQKGSPWQNGIQESFYSNFKLEVGEVNRFETVGELVEFIHRQIAYYNDERIHSSLDMSPTKFRQQIANINQKQATTVAV